MNIVTQNEADYICLTDIARLKDPERTDYLISNWMRNRNTVEFLGIWEQLHNPGFNPVEFDGIKKRKINYRIHTDAIKDTLIPPSITKAQAFKERGRLSHILPLHFSVSDFQPFSIYRTALFGQTAKQWRDANPGAEGNLRDHAPPQQTHPTPT